MILVPTTKPRKKGSHQQQCENNNKPKPAETKKSIRKSGAHATGQVLAANSKDLSFYKLLGFRPSGLQGLAFL